MVNLDHELLKDMKQMRRRLHRIPEVGFELYNTHEVVKEYLTAYGYHCETAAKTGLIAVKEGATTDQAIAFRADMDGLMVNEKNDVDYTSNHPGKMHACGHDGHMAILLGLAKFLSSVKTTNKTVVLIFQPAEEGPGGAKNIIGEGVLEKYNIEYIFGLHIYPGLEQGEFGITKGPLMAQNGEIDITVNGKSCHGAAPQNGSDAVVAASNLVMAYQNISSRKIDARQPVILTLGIISGGEARNIIAESVELTGTIRAFDSSIYDTIKSQITSINQGIEKMYDVTIDMEIRDFYPPVINDIYLYEIVYSSIASIDSNKIRHVDPLMLAEDFSFYQQEIPGFFMLLGSKNETKGFTSPLHSGAFDFDEEILISGLEAYLKICETLEVF